MKFEAIELYRVRGNADRITSEEKITGILDFVPLPNGRAYLMLPVEDLIATNEEHRKRGIMGIPPLSKMDITTRGILELTLAESRKALLAEPGYEFSITRHGWGKTWVHRIRKT